MSRIKDFIYDKNDLLVALVIVLAAGFLIMSRVDVIMAYPASLEAEMDSPIDNTVAKKPDNQSKPPGADAKDPGDTSEQEEPGNPGTAGETNDTEAPVSPNTDTVSIHIAPGSTGSQIAEVLIDAGLISGKDIFYDAIAASGSENRLQAGSFKIPVGSTPSQIVRIITK